MPEVLLRVKFKATPETPSWPHRRAYIAKEVLGGSATPTARVHGPVLMKDGDIESMDQFETDWCLVHYPANFSLVQRNKSIPTPKGDE